VPKGQVDFTNKSWSLYPSRL